jgi:hypothetical protein
MPLFKLITILILQRTLARVLNCCKILVVIYFNLFNYGKSWIVVLFIFLQFCYWHDIRIVY